MVGRRYRGEGGVKLQGVAQRRKGEDKLRPVYYKIRPTCATAKKNYSGIRGDCVISA